MLIKILRYTYFLFIIAWCCSYRVASSQVVTRLPSVQVCPDGNFEVPVSFENLISVDTFQLVFGYNTAAFTYSGFSYLHPNLLGTRFKVVAGPGSIKLTLGKGVALNFTDGNLVVFTFKARRTGSALSWDRTQSNYQLAGQPLVSTYVDGSIEVFPKPNIALKQIPAEVCPGSFNASVIATITGGAPPYLYQWIGSPIQVLSDSIARNLATGSGYKLRITDGNNCSYDTTFFVKTRILNKVEIVATPDTVFISNPQITCKAENKSAPFITRYLWRFGDGDSTITATNSTFHVYSGVKKFVEAGGKQYEISLKITNEFGCDTTIVKTLIIREAKVFIPNVFTPNGDGANDLFRIVLDDNKEKDITYEYVKLEVLVFNRWGRKVYSSNDYKSNWDGGNLSDGVYYYVLNAHGLFMTDTYKGVVHILR